MSKFPRLDRPGRRGGPYAPSRAVVLGLLVALTLITCAVGFLQKLPCRAGAWNSGWGQYAYACYTDIYPLYFAEGLAHGTVPYIDHPVEYPVLIGAAMRATAWVVSPLPDAYVAGRAFYDINVVLLIVAAVAAVVATALALGRGPERAVMFAVAPGLAFAAYINWDLLAVAFAALAVLGWARRRPVLAGVLLGLGVATKFYPLVLLGPLFLLCLRTRRLGAFARTFLAAAVTWTAVNVPVYLAAPRAWATFYAFSRERGAGWGSIWLLLQRLGVPGIADVSTLNLVGTGVFLVCCVSIAALALLAPRRPRLAQLVFLTLAAFILTNKVWSPQYVLWLLPFAVLARPRWPAFLAWQGAWLLYFVAIWYYLLHQAAPDAGVGPAVYFPLLAVRVVAVAGLCGLIVREVLRPGRDSVRVAGDDDPIGGVLDGAPD